MAGNVLHHLVSHARPFSVGEGREVRRFLENSVTEEPGGVVELGLFPGLLVEVLLVVVDEDDGVGGDEVSGYLGVSVGDVRHDGRAGGADCLPEGGLEEHELGLLCQAELLARREAGLDLLPEPPLDGRPGGHVYQHPGGEVGDGAVAAQHVLQGEQGLLQVEGLLRILRGNRPSTIYISGNIAYIVLLIRFHFLQQRVEKIFVSGLTSLPIYQVGLDVSPHVARPLFDVSLEFRWGLDQPG